MDNYAMRIRVPAGELKEILDTLTAAQQTIYDCYDRLVKLGVVEIEEAASMGG